MQTRAKVLTAGVAALAGGAAGVSRLRALDRRLRADILADPVGELLEAPLEGGRPLPVASSDGTRIHAQLFGPDDAPTVVLGHGWMEGTRFFTHQIRELSRDHRVVAWDLRGHGRSGDPTGGDYSIEAIAADLDAVLEAALPAGERAVVAGHSLGGMAIVAWAGINPDAVRERVGAAALLNTGVHGLIADSLVIRSPAALEWTRDAIGRTILAAPGRLPSRSSPVSYEVVRYLALGPDAGPATVAFCEELLLSCGPEARAGCGATLAELHLVESIASLDVPTLVVAGERDRLTPPVHSRRLVDALPQGEYLELERIAHMSPVEAPDEIARRLRALARDQLAPVAAR